MNISYQEYLSKNPEDKLKIFMESLSKTNHTPQYFVNWNKVTSETEKYKRELNTLNQVIDSEDIYHDILKLFIQQPDLVKVIPALMATREHALDLISFDEKDYMETYNLDFKNIDLENIRSYVDFIDQAGLLDFLQANVHYSLVDYMYGVETGLDSNGRKNRSGTTMEIIFETEIKKICEELGVEHKSQATADFISKNWHIEVPTDKAKRRFDEAVYDKKTKKLWLFETNYYGSNGSKLKSVAGEFQDLNQRISSVNNPDITFIWVTDGQGWKGTEKALNEAFEVIPNIFNLKMISDGFLRDLFIKK